MYHNTTLAAVNFDQHFIVTGELADIEAIERGLIKETYPQVSVPEVGEEPTDYPMHLLEPGWINVFELTAEDYTRTSSYRADAARKVEFCAHATLEDYLKELNIVIDLFVPESMALNRTAQLCARTNQFNRTTCRYTEPQIKEMAADPHWLIVCISANDKFGENGIIGCMFFEANHTQKQIWIWNFILSCRVFSRGIEDAAFSHIIENIMLKGYTEIYAEYIASKKNYNVKNFYLDKGFELYKENLKGWNYRYPLSTMKNQATWIKRNHKIK